jgi:hypothetical protein
VEISKVVTTSIPQIDNMSCIWHESTKNDHMTLTVTKLGTKVLDVTWGVQILIKNKLQIPSVNRETNLLRLINLSLAHVIVAPYCQIMN